VIDASAAVALAIAGAELARLGEFDLVAPPLMWSEGVSALVEATYRGALPVERLDESIQRLEALPIAAAGGTADLRRDAARLARSLGWAKTYDAEYVALAQVLGCQLLTTDARLERGIRGLVEVLRPADLAG
jgi:predicted nucleic acid-binding protein